MRYLFNMIQQLHKTAYLPPEREREREGHTDCACGRLPANKKNKRIQKSDN